MEWSQWSGVSSGGHLDWLVGSSPLLHSAAVNSCEFNTKEAVNDLPGLFVTRGERISETIETDINSQNRAVIIIFFLKNIV